MSPRYRFDTDRSRFTVQAFAGGILSFVGHSPTFRARDFGGTLHSDGDDLRALALELTINPGSLELLDKVGDGDRREIEGRMRREVLEVDRFPAMTFRSDNIAARPNGPDRYRLDIRGELSLHGVAKPYRLDAELSVSDDSIRLRGTDRLSMPDFRIKPITALAGAIRLKDELRLTFDLVGTPEAP